MLERADTKFCTKCNETLKSSAFHRNQRWCKDCENSHRRARYAVDDKYRRRIKENRDNFYKNNREACIIRNRKSEILRKYGLSWGQYQEILIKQGNRCALCGTDEPRGQGTWHIDHDHITRVVRGLLCHSCNTMLGIYEKFLAKFGGSAIANYLKSDTGVIANAAVAKRGKK